MDSLCKKTESEKKILNKMVAVYCKGQGHSKDGDLCGECRELLEYSLIKIDKCPFMETKTFCSSCKVHCYDKEHQERIKQVMKYAGPRMIFKAPVAAISHLINTKKQQLKIYSQKNGGKMFEKFNLRDIVFIAVLSAVLTIFGMITMPLVMTVTLFGVRNAAAALFYGFFCVIGMMKVKKAGTLTLIAVFNGAILLMMSPVMFFNNVTSAIVAEAIGLIIFRNYKKDKSAIFTAGLFIPLTLPSSIIFGMILNGYTFSEVVEAPTVSIGICLAAIILSYLGSYLGYRVCVELRKAGKMS